MIRILSIKTNKPAKKLGRGVGSGVGGHTVGRGGKGQSARGGHKLPRPGFEGGQNPISRRLPKLRGFRRGYQKSRLKTRVLKLSEIDRLVKQEKLEKVTFETLVEYGLIKPQYNKTILFKVLFDNEPVSKIKLEGINVSEKAANAILKAGGTVVRE